jgi:hypothetical protein
MRVITIFFVLIIIYCLTTLVFYIWHIGHKRETPLFAVINTITPSIFIPGFWEYNYAKWAENNPAPYKGLIIVLRPVLFGLILATAFYAWRTQY